MHKSAGKLLDKQQNMLHSLNVKVRNYLFNNNFIELRQIKQNKSQNSLNYFIYLKQPLYFNNNNIKEIDLNTILKLSSFKQTREQNFVCESVDILNDGSYFFNFCHRNLSSNKFCTYFSIFDPVSRRISKEKLMDNIFFWNIKTNKNLIALQRYNDNNYFLSIMNLDLEIVMEKKTYLRDANESFIFVSFYSEYEYDGIEISLLDWSLNELKSLKFKPSVRNHFDFNYLKDKFIVHFLNDSYTLRIFDENSLLLKQVDLGYPFKLAATSNENIILLPDDNKKLIYLNSNGDLLKEIDLIDYKFNWKRLTRPGSYNRIKFDKNDNIAFILEYSKLIIFN